MQVPFYGHVRQYHNIKSEIDANIHEVLESGQYVMGPMLKGAGAIVFILDYVVRHSPASFLLFAVSDGAMAAQTVVARPPLPRAHPRQSHQGAPRSETPGRWLVRSAQRDRSR